MQASRKSWSTTGEIMPWDNSVCGVSARFHGPINEVVPNVGLEGKDDLRKSMILPGNSRSSPLSKQRETCVTSGQWQETECGRNKHYKRAKAIKGPEANMGRPRPPQIMEGLTHYHQAKGNL